MFVLPAFGQLRVADITLDRVSHAYPIWKLNVIVAHIARQLNLDLQDLSIRNFDGNMRYTMMAVKKRFKCLQCLQFYGPLSTFESDA